MKKTNYVLVSVLFVFVLLLSGCGLTSQERMEAVKGYVSQAQDVSAQVDDQLKVVTETIDGLEETLATLPADSPVVEKITKGLAEARDVEVELIEKKAEVDKVIVDLNETLQKIKTEGADWIDELGMIATGAQSVGVSVGSAAGGWITAAGTIVLSLLTIFRKIKDAADARKEAAEIKQNFSTVVKSVTAGLSALPAEASDLAKSKMKEIQGPAVTAAVKEIKQT